MNHLINKGTARLAWIDNLRGLSCILVLISHSHTPIFVTRFISPFFLCLFFFLSGYLFKDRPVKDSLRNIFNRLIVPYAFAAVACTLITYFGSGNYAIDLKLIKRLIYSVVWGKTLWFIPCLIVIEIAYTFLIKLKINRILLAIPFILTIFLTNNNLILNGIWGCAQALFCITYFILGNGIKDSIWLKKDTRTISLILTAIYLIIYFTWFIMPGSVAKTIMAYNEYGNPLQFIILSIFSTTTIFFLTKNFLTKRLAWLDLFGLNSLWIFAIQQALCDILRPGPLYHSTNPWICIPVFLILSIPSVIISELIRRYLPLAAGKVEVWK